MGLPKRKEKKKKKKKKEEKKKLGNFSSFFFEILSGKKGSKGQEGLRSTVGKKKLKLRKPERKPRTRKKVSKLARHVKPTHGGTRWLGELLDCDGASLDSASQCFGIQEANPEDASLRRKSTKQHCFSMVVFRSQRLEGVSFRSTGRCFFGRLLAKTRFLPLDFSCLSRAAFLGTGLLTPDNFWMKPWIAEHMRGVLYLY